MSIDKKIEQLKTSFLILNLEELDQDVFDFFIKNFELYNTKKQVKRKIIGDSVITFSDFGQKFIIKFIPSYVNPTQVELKLINLNGLLEQKYLVIFKEKNTVEITKVKTSKNFNSDIRMDTNCKKTNTSIYSDGIRIYENNSYLLLNSSVDYNTGGFSREEKYYVDNGIYTSYTSMGEEDCIFGNVKKYTKELNGITENITENEYNGVKIRINSKHPVLTKN